MILYFVRHGETDWNVKKKIQGKTDVPLNENGKQQAKELADLLLDRKKEGTLQVVRAYTSPQLRAAQTAQEAAIALDIPCIAADGLREMDMGDWEGRSWESITMNPSPISRKFSQPTLKTHGPTTASLPTMQIKEIRNMLFNT
mgnify:FL=1